MINIRKLKQCLLNKSYVFHFGWIFLLFFYRYDYAFSLPQIRNTFQWLCVLTFCFSLLFSHFMIKLCQSVQFINCLLFVLNIFLFYQVYFHILGEMERHFCVSFFLHIEQLFSRKERNKETKKYNFILNMFNTSNKNLMAAAISEANMKMSLTR